MPTIHIGLKEATELVKAHFRTMLQGKGCTCPTCNRFAKVYDRKFNSSMARALIWFYRYWQQYGDTWIHVPTTAPKWLVASREFGKLQRYDLIARREGFTDAAVKKRKKKDPGIYRITERGRKFVLGAWQAKQRCISYYKEKPRFVGDLITIEEALGKHYHYGELMATEAYMDLAKIKKAKKVKREH